MLVFDSFGRALAEIEEAYTEPQLRRYFLEAFPEWVKVTNTFAVQSRATAISGTQNKEWISRLPEVVKVLNNETTCLMGEKLSLAIWKKSVKAKPAAPRLRLVGFKEQRLPSDVMVRYLYALGELEGGERRRATDPIWSMTSHQVEWAVVEGGKPLLYYLSYGPSARLCARSSK